MNNIALVTACVAFALVSGSASAAQLSPGATNNNNGKAAITGTTTNGASQGVLPSATQKSGVDKKKEHAKQKGNIK